MIVDYRKYKLFDYQQNTSINDMFVLGEVVIHKDTFEVGVIIQAYGNDEYRTDAFGNCSVDEIEKATVTNVLMNRPSLLD
ncbi:MAG: hypothetical protein WD512_20305 [Candidatus Paceibacterota bacterium]